MPDTIATADTGERRRITDQINSVVNSRMKQCKEDVDADINTVRDGLDRLESSLTSLRNDHHELRADVHRQTIAFQDIASSMREVAEMMRKLTDLPEAWSALKGFWKVMQILRQNAILLIMLVGLVVFIVSHMTWRDLIGWVLP